MYCLFRAAAKQCFFALVFAAMASPIYSQQMELQSVNPGFWNSSPSGLQGGRSLWVANEAVTEGLNEGGLAYLLDSSFYQVVPINGKSQYHLLRAEVSAVLGTSGWTGMGISYYGADWGFLWSFETPILDSGFGVVDPANASSLETLGVRIPDGSAYAVIWFSAVGGAEAVVDNAGLYNYFPAGQSNHDPAAPEFDRYTLGRGEFDTVVVNGDFRFAREIATEWGNARLDSQSAPPSKLALKGDEFWGKGNYYDNSVRGGELSLLVGNRYNGAVTYQEIDLLPETTYTFSSFVGRDGSGTGSFPLCAMGIDFFDANWTLFDSRVAPFSGSTLTQTNQQIQQQFTTPAGAVHATLWIYVPPVDGTNNYATFAFSELRVKRFDAEDLAPRTFVVAADVTTAGDSLHPFSIFGTPADSITWGAPQLDVTAVGPFGGVSVQAVAGGINGDAFWEFFYLRAPGGTWGPEDNGTYTIRVPAGYFESTNGMRDSLETTYTIEVRL